MIALLIIFALGGLMHAAGTFAGGGASATELAFGYLLLSAFFVARVTSKLGLPKLSGYIATGILAGPHVLGLVSKPMTGQLKIVGEVAVCILAMTAGAELVWTKIKPVIKTLRAITLFGVVGAMLMLGAALFLMSPLLPFLDEMPVATRAAVCGMIGVAMSAQSPAVVMAVLGETRADGPLSQVMIASVVIADVVVIVLYAIAASVASATTGGGFSLSSTALAIGWEVIGSILFGCAIGAVIGLYVQHVKKGASLFAIMVNVLVAEIGTRIHLDPLITMLAAGIWFQNVSKADAHELLGEFETAQLPVFLVFFAVAGCKLDLGAMAAAIVPVGILATVRATSFFVGCRVATRGADTPAIVRRYAWIGLVPQAGLALALALLIQKSFPTFGDAASVVLFGVVGVNELAAPIILRLVLLRSGEAGKRVETDLVVDH